MSAVQLLEKSPRVAPAAWSITNTDFSPASRAKGSSHLSGVHVRPVNLAEDGADIRAWLQRARGDATSDEFRGVTDEEVAGWCGDTSVGWLARALIGVQWATGEKIGLILFYRPALDRVGDFIDASPRDLGCRLLMASTNAASSSARMAAMLRAAEEAAFEDPKVMRLVFQPDLRQTALLTALASVGMGFGPVLQMPGRTAQLVSVTRDQACAVIRVASRSAGPKPAWQVHLHRQFGRVYWKLFRHLDVHTPGSVVRRGRTLPRA